MPDDPVEIEEVPEEENEPSVLSPLERVEPYQLEEMYPEPEVDVEPPPPPEPPTVVPNAPTIGVVSTGTVSGEVLLGFPPVVNADSYVLFWTDNPLIPIDPADSTTYINSQVIAESGEVLNEVTIGLLMDGTLYSFALLATNIIGDSELSVESQALPSAPPPPILPSAVTNVDVTVGTASGVAILTFDEVTDSTMLPVTYSVYLSQDPNVPIDPVDPLTYSQTHVVTNNQAIPQTFVDGDTIFGVMTANNVTGVSPLSDVFYFRTVPAPNAPAAPEIVNAEILSSETPDVSYLPLRLLDEEVGMLLEKQLRRISPLEEPKSLQSFLSRPRLIHWGRGESPFEVLGNLYRLSDRTRVQLPLVVLYRESTMESWTEETGIPGFKEKHGAVLGFYPIRLQYRLMVIAFEQPVLDLLTMALYTTLRGNYRLSFPLEGHGFQMTVGGTVLEGDSISFTHEVVTNEETRLYATRAEFALGTFSYHVAAAAVPTLPIRYQFEQLRILGNESTK